jgi:hypothetical protein
MKLFCADLPLKQRDFLRQKVIDDRIAFSDVVDQVLYLPLQLVNLVTCFACVNGLCFCRFKAEGFKVGFAAENNIVLKSSCFNILAVPADSAA